jgi:hypothetical protein
VDSHNELSKNLKAEQEKAKNALRYHEVKKSLTSSNMMIKKALYWH